MGHTAPRTNTGIYFIMESDSFEAVTGFLGPPLLEDHDGHIASVLTLGESVDVVLED